MFEHLRNRKQIDEGFGIINKMQTQLLDMLENGSPEEVPRVQAKLNFVAYQQMKLKILSDIMQNV